MRSFRSFVSVACLALLPAAAMAGAPDPTAEEAAIKAHVAFLSSDSLRGREAGSGDDRIAADYIAARFLAAGLTPAGDTDGDTRGWLQRVPLTGYRLKDGATATLDGVALGKGDATIAANPAAATTKVAGGVVFVGRGIVSAPNGIDDYAGVDVRGRIVAFLPGAPETLSGEERAFLGSAATKARFAAERGAIGLVQLPTATPAPKPTASNGTAPTPAPTATPAPAPTPAAPATPARPSRRMAWAEPDGTGHVAAPSVPLLATLTPAGATRLFAKAHTGWARLAKAKGRAPAQPLGVTLAVDSATQFDAFTSWNVVGILPGSDPGLAKEIVVLTAHLDHIGVSERPDAKGDRINNGALDDAIGIASLIEEARRFAADPKRPRRTIAFVAVTGEEKGLVGSDWFVTHRPKGLEDIVADVNLDMPVLTYTFADMVAFGGDRSTLGPAVARAAAAAGVSLSPDPMPEQGIFVRSDHFRFVQQGVPAIFLWPGYANGGREAITGFMARCYHRPCDDMTQPIRWDQAARFVDLNARIAREIADADDRPRWKKGDYFGTLFRGPMQP